MKLIAVLSGGMDSTAAMAVCKHAGHEIIGAITFDYGSKHNGREFLSALQIVNHYELKINRVQLDFIADHFKSDLLKTGGEIPEGHYADPSMKRTVVPFRNGIMLSIAAGFAESLDADGIILGNHFGDHAIYPDCREDFAKAMAQAISLGTYKNIALVTPFQNMTKTQIVEAGHAIGVPFALTYSCYKGGELHCGKCGTCVERREAFEQSGINDPTEYA